MIDKRLVQVTVDAYCAHQSTDGSLNKAIEEALEAYEAECWRSIDEALRMQLDKKTLNVTDKRVAAILDVNQYHIKQMNEFKNRIDAAKKRLGDLKAKHTEWYRKRSTEDDHIALISEMESIAYSVSCYLDGAPGAYLEKEETS